MTLSIERSRTRRPVTWLTLVGVILLPVLIGGLLVAALYNPIERLDNLSAAIVNEDEPVTIGEQYVPLGRQLTAGLVEGSDDLASNLSWTISNATDAADGLADGRYAAVITIPSNFSAAATSTRPGETPERATIQVETSPDALIVDDAITAQVTQAAASLMGQQLSEVYLENVFLGFTTLGDQLGEAASGAGKLADGARDASDGAVSLADGVRQLSSGASQLGTGASGISTGAGALADGAGQLGGGLDTIAGGVSASSTGARDLATGLRGGADELQYGTKSQGLVGAAEMVTAQTKTAAADSTAAATALGALVAQCSTVSSDPAFCTALTAAADKVGTAASAAGTANGYAPSVSEGIPALLAGTADGMRGAAVGAGKLAGGLTQLATGTSQSATGARGLQSGAAQLQSGAAQLATGADSLATGAGSAADGADTLGSGVAQLADGTSELANGLSTAVDQVPSYSESEAQSLAGVVSNPVEADGVGTTLFGASAIPLLAMLALWFGGLATFIALRAVSARALTSRAPSALLAGRALLPAAGIGGLQGLLVAIVVQLAASYEWSAWWAFAGIAVLAGIVFAAVNQALVAVFGGAGRWVAALVGVLAVATGVVSTAPGVLASVASFMPTSPAYSAMLGALGPAGGIGASVVGLLVWGFLAFVATILSVVRHRTTSASALLKASPVAA